jgi:hypothetical protein
MRRSLIVALPALGLAAVAGLVVVDQRQPARDSQGLADSHFNLGRLVTDGEPPPPPGLTIAEATATSWLTADGEPPPPPQPSTPVVIAEPANTSWLTADGEPPPPPQPSPWFSRPIKSFLVDG